MDKNSVPAEMELTTKQKKIIKIWVAIFVFLLIVFIILSAIL